MAEPGLSLGFSDFQKQVAYNLGYTRDSTTWNVAKTEQIDRIIQNGYGNFLSSHDWKFMKPTVTLDIWADVGLDADVTVTGVYDLSTYSVVTATEATFYNTMVGKSIVITGAGTFVIYSYTSATVITVVGDATAAAATFSIASGGSFDLPDDYGGFEGKWTFEPDESQFPITVIGEGQIRTRQQRGETSERPRFIGIRPKVFNPTVGQRFEIIMWPDTDGYYQLAYKQRTQRGKLTATNQYPVGGVAHCRTVEAFCQAEAEMETDRQPGAFAAAAQLALARSIQIDNEQNTPDSLGYNDDPSMYGRARMDMGSDLATYDGTLYDG